MNSSRTRWRQGLMAHAFLLGLTLAGGEVLAMGADLAVPSQGVHAQMPTGTPAQLSVSSGVDVYPPDSRPF